MTAPYQIDAGGLIIGKDTPYDIRSVEGWDSPPDSKADESDNDNDHGAYIGDLFSRPRVVTVEVGIHGDPLDPEVLEDRITALRDVMVPDVDDNTVRARWAADAVPWYVTAERRRMHLVRQGGNALSLTICLLEWTCGDPRQYLEDVDTTTILFDSVQVVVPNAGNTAAPFVARFTGPVTNPRLIDDIRGIADKFTMTIGAGTYIDLDTKERTALSGGGSNNYGNLSEFDLLDVPRGGRQMRATGTGTTGASKIEIYSQHTRL